MKNFDISLGKKIAVSAVWWCKRVERKLHFLSLKKKKKTAASATLYNCIRKKIDVKENVFLKDTSDCNKGRKKKNYTHTHTHTHTWEVN